MFTNTKALAIPDGDVIKVECDGVILWELPSSYKNQIPTSIDTDGSIFNGVGYVPDTRLSSSGGTKAASGVMTTGYIPAKPSDNVYLGGITWINSNQASTNYVCCYDSKFNFVCAVNCNGYYGGGTVSGDSNMAVVTLPNTDTIAFVRVSVKDQSETYAQFIVTVNEPIE